MAPLAQLSQCYQLRLLVQWVQLHPVCLGYPLGLLDRLRLKVFHLVLVILLALLVQLDPLDLHLPVFLLFHLALVVQLHRLVLLLLGCLEYQWDQWDQLRLLFLLFLVAPLVRSVQLDLLLPLSLLHH